MQKKMVENKTNGKTNGQHTEVTKAFPSPWCSKACVHSLSDICMEDCAVARDARHFTPKKIFSIWDAARYPAEQVADMSPKEARAMFSFYLGLVINEVLGVTHDKYTPNPRRRGQVPETIAVQDILFGQTSECPKE